MSSAHIFNSLLAGLIAGLASGFLGVSPGGVLVPVIALLLPFPQHVVQGISLIVQAPPTSVSGLSVYSQRGRPIALVPILFVAAGFVTGGPVGAIAAKMCSGRELRWMFVAYLLILASLAALKKSTAASVTSEAAQVQRSSSLVLLGIGFIAGIFSGLLGIGGGVAITALSILLLHKRQHEAQALSLAITALPLTLPAAWVYVRQGWQPSWLVIGYLIAGLTLGTWIGALFANRQTERTLKIAFVLLLIAMAAYMAVIANRH